MDPFSLEQRIFLVKCYYRNQNSISNVLDEFSKEFITSTIVADDIFDVITCFEEFGHVERKLKSIANASIFFKELNNYVLIFVN